MIPLEISWEILKKIPLELIDFIYEKIDRHLLIKISSKNNGESVYSILNKKRISNFREKMKKYLSIDIRDLVMKDNVKVMEYLMENSNDKKAEILFQSFELLMTASNYGQLEMVKYLYPFVSDLRSKSLALIPASRFGYLEIVKYLVSSKISVEAKNEALLQACERGYLEIVKCLIEIGTFYNLDNAVQKAILNEHLEIVKYLVNQGADTTIQNNKALREISRRVSTDTRDEIINYLWYLKNSRKI